MAEIVRRIRPGQYWRIKEHESCFQTCPSKMTNSINYLYVKVMII